jgi:signal transduction histidine kinase
VFQSGKHLLALINDILDLSKVEAGKMTLDLEPVELNDLLRSCMNIVMDQAARRDISLNFAPYSGNDRIVADVRKLRQIVYNLLSNAVKFSNEGGSVSLSVHAARRDALQLSVPSGMEARLLPLPPSEFVDFVEIRVSDNGIGIRSADFPRLFQTFQQIDSSLARQHEGAGLGLALVSRLAELHAGAAGVASALGRGSQFSVWLPRRTDHVGIAITDAALSPTTSPPATAIGISR